MFFGLTNSPATFQTMMNDLFHDLISRGVVVVYLDDILVFTKTLDEHRQVVREVLEILRKNRLFLKPEKCVFGVQKVEFLGYEVSPGRLAMNETKVNGIKEWPTPTKDKDIRSFLGFGNFYQRFISNFAEIAWPLNELTRKGQEWL